VASTIFAEPDDIATFSRGNLVPPRPDARDATEQTAPTSDPFFGRLQAASKTDDAQRTDLADDGESTDAYFDRLATQSPADMSTSAAPSPAASPMPGSALLPADLARPRRHHGRLRRRLIPPALTVGLSPLRRSRLAWRLSTAALGVLAALVAGIAVIGEPGSPGSERQQSQREASASSLEPLRPSGLATSANPFGATALVHRSVARVRRPHHSHSGRPKRHRVSTPTSIPVQTTVNHRVLAANYTPAEHTSASIGATSETQSRSATGSTLSATPVAPTRSTSSSNSGSGSASPSKATLRSLVTGAGTCSCQ
jgi:hypothetical protein